MALRSASCLLYSGAPSGEAAAVMMTESSRDTNSRSDITSCNAFNFFALSIKLLSTSALLNRNRMVKVPTVSGIAGSATGDCPHAFMVTIKQKVYSNIFFIISFVCRTDEMILCFTMELCLPNSGYIWKITGYIFCSYTQRKDVFVIV